MVIETKCQAGVKKSGIKIWAQCGRGEVMQPEINKSGALEIGSRAEDSLQPGDLRVYPGLHGPDPLGWSWWRPLPQKRIEQDGE